MDPLIEQHYVLTEPKKCVDQAVSKIILMDEVEFTITDEVLICVNKALEYKLELVDYVRYVKPF
jgi:hypothetical protein